MKCNVCGAKAKWEDGFIVCTDEACRKCWYDGLDYNEDIAKAIKAEIKERESFENREPELDKLNQSL